MKCENLQFNLPLYLDNSISETERAALVAHLGLCPVCRQKLADFQHIKNNLRVMARPAMPQNLMNSVRLAVAAQIETPEPKRIFSPDFRRWLEMRFMPYAVGTAATFLFTFLLLGAMLSGANPNSQTSEIARNESSKVLLTNPSEFTFSRKDESIITQEDFARNRLSVSGESPSLNPTGAIVALTKSLVRGKMKGNEFVVVADVFDNGLAQIAEIVESPQDKETIENLKNAFNADEENAPFLPANLDNRASEVRVVFKIQLVDVQTSKPVKKTVRR
ncbi:MAG TPA: zf-HC2 domain-containing protein [Pyrinomonadaceae bacterium]|nr:zf-HC2 domain-containing protein [Pyrinomonadaceae bacterium]